MRKNQNYLSSLSLVMPPVTTNPGPPQIYSTSTNKVTSSHPSLSLRSPWSWASSRTMTRHGQQGAYTGPSGHQTSFEWSSALGIVPSLSYLRDFSTWYARRSVLLPDIYFFHGCQVLRLIVEGKFWYWFRRKSTDWPNSQFIPSILAIQSFDWIASSLFRLFYGITSQ